MAKNPYKIDDVINFPEAAKFFYTVQIRDERPYSAEEKFGGKLAVSLQLFDYLLGKCKGNNCPDFGNQTNILFNILSRLSIGKCVELKAYHIWDDKNRPLQTIQERDQDYRKAFDGILEACNASICWKKSKAPGPVVLSKIKAFYDDKPQEYWEERKTKWRSLANPLEGHHINSSAAKLYVSNYFKFLNGANPCALRDFIKENASMMSALSFFYLSCHSKSTP